MEQPKQTTGEADLSREQMQQIVERDLASYADDIESAGFLVDEVVFDISIILAEVHKDGSFQDVDVAHVCAFGLDDIKELIKRNKIPVGVSWYSDLLLKIEILEKFEPNRIPKKSE